MQFITIVAALAFATGTQAWANDGRGTWVANNNWWVIRGTHVHEACTKMNDNTVIYRNNEACGYWTDGAGTIKNGHCKQTNKEPSTVGCV